MSRVMQLTQGGWLRPGFDLQGLMMPLGFCVWLNGCLLVYAEGLS